MDNTIFQSFSIHLLGATRCTQHQNVAMSRPHVNLITDSLHLSGSTLGGATEFTPKFCMKRWWSHVDVSPGAFLCVVFGPGTWKAQTASWTAKKGGLRETRGAGSSREGRWPSAPFSSRILLLSLPRRLLEHVFPSGYTITLSGWWYTYPSEKYESIGRIIPIYYGKIIQMFQTTSQIMYIYSYYCIYPSILLKDFHGFCDP